MRKIVTGLFTSLDGVVDADGDWQFTYFDDELFEWINAAWNRADVALIGRRSFAGYDALRRDHPDSPMLGFLERAERYVVSTTLKDADWPGTTIIGTDLHRQLTELKQRPGKDILVCGSPSVVRWLLARGLLDELNISILPVVVGSGPQLFPDSATDHALTRVSLDLTTTTTLRSGVVMLSYTPADQ